MNCPKCEMNTAVVDSRNTNEMRVRRCRQCLACKHRFYTVEIEEKDVRVLIKAYTQQMVGPAIRAIEELRQRLIDL